MADSTQFIKAHGIALVKNSWIKNATVESLENDPELLTTGRIWYNTTDNVFKGSFFDGEGQLIAVSFATKAELDAFIGLLSSEDGSDYIGFKGFQPTTGTFELSGGTLTDAITTIAEKTSELDDLLSNGAAAGVDVTDEYLEVLSQSKKINFVGQDVLAVVNQAGDGVDVYIPAPNFAPMYNKEDAVVADNTTVSRKLAANTASQYEIGDWTPGTAYPTTNNTVFSFNPPVKIGFANASTSFEVKVYGADGTTVLSSYVLENISGNIANVQENGIEIGITGWEEDLFRFKANVDIKVHLDSILPHGGRFSVEVTHHNGTLGDHTKLQGPVMFDYNGGAASIGQVTIEEKTPVIKKISGVNYYGLNSTFDVGLSDIDNINALTWPTNDVVIKAKSSELNNFYGITLYDIKANATDITGWTNVWNASDLSSTSVRTTSRKNFRYIGTAAKAAFTVVAKMTGTSDFFSDAKAIMVDTYDGLSNDKEETFTDEVYRLKANLTDKWDSAALLADDELMVCNDKLQRKFGDWTTYKPANTANYSTDAGQTQYYYREFKHAGVSHSNGLFNIGGITEADLTNGTVKIEISTNGTDWYDCSKDYTSGQLTNGAGCRINKDTNKLPKLEFTLGTGGSTDASSGSAGFGIFVRISMPAGSTAKLEHIRITNW